jgi:hypothetical protein
MFNWILYFLELNYAKQYYTYQFQFQYHYKKANSIIAA